MSAARRYASSAASVLLGAALAAVAFGGKGGSDLTRITWVEICIVLAAGLAAAIAAAYGPGERPLYGGAPLLLLAALAALTALSVLWSIVPDASWVEAGRTLAYLGVFAGGIGLARAAPQAWRVLLYGLLLAAAAITAYALASRVFPASLAPNELYARIGQPYGYWNAVGVTAGLAVPPAVWLGARRSGYAPANALAYPLLGILYVALFLSYSRGALAATVLALILWLVFVPLRLRSLVTALVPAAGAAPVIAWALSKDAFTKDLQPLSAKESVAGSFGLALAAMAVALLAVGLAIGFGLARRAPSPVVRRRAGLAAVAVACLIPLAGLTSVAFSQKGLTGTISDRLDQLTSPTAKTSGGPSRLTQTSSSRGRYWRQAGDIFDDHTLAGTGAGTFGTARLRYRDDRLVARHAHGFFAQTMADLGAIGLAVASLFAIAWLVCAARTLGLRAGRLPWRRRAPASAPAGRWDPERVGLAAIALAALVFGLHSAIDWTWFVPGPAVMGIFAAGFAAGRGPLPATAPAGPAAGPPLPPAGGRLRLPPAPRAVAGLAVLGCALLLAWAIAQPERSDSASQEAIALADAGKLGPAIEKARHARDIDSLSPTPLLVQAGILDAAHQRQRALALLQDAVIRFPSQPQVWLRLADYELNRMRRPRDALTALRGTLYLDPLNEAARSLFVAARAELRGRAAPPSAVQAPPTGEQAPSPGE